MDRFADGDRCRHSKRIPVLSIYGALQLCDRPRPRRTILSGSSEQVRPDIKYCLRHPAYVSGRTLDRKTSRSAVCDTGCLGCLVDLLHFGYRDSRGERRSDERPSFGHYFVHDQTGSNLFRRASQRKKLALSDA